MRREELKKVILLVVCFMLLSVASYSAIIRVRTDGIDTNDGSSWELAKKTVTAALTAAVSGDEIWVAKGTYVERITLKDAVKLYGGFAGTETVLEQRNWKINVTVLDGNAGGPVVTSPSGVTNTAKIDSFTIQNGSLGVNCTDSSPVIANNIIIDNSGDFYGGGIRCFSASPFISNNTITNNSSGSGGGIYCHLSSGTIINNTITGNTADTYGGGIYCEGSSPIIANNIIKANSCNIIDTGGGIYCQSSSPIITNNTIIGNGYNGIYCYYSSPQIFNNIIAFNSLGIYSYHTYGSPILRNNCVYNPGGYNYSGLTAGVGDKSMDPKLVSYEYGQVHIQPDSPCKDAGYDAAVGMGTLDMDSEVRISGSHVDIGADESNGATWTYTPTVIRVGTTGNDTNDGSSWDLSKKTVQAAINAASVCGADIWVARGTYSEIVEIRAFAHLYGGFAGTEVSVDQRDWMANTTIIEGNASLDVVGVHGIGFFTSRIDGFTICNGHRGISCYFSSLILSNNTVAANKGVGIYCYSSSPTISNNIINGNSSGGISCYQSNSYITNNTITSNSSDGSGGGISCDYSSPAISNNIVAFNSSGICNSNGNPVLRNNCFYNHDYANYSGISAGFNDISVDPMLVAYNYGQFHIQHSSPCKDTGYDAANGVGTLDIDSEARIQGPHVDIGADESDGNGWDFTPRVIRVSTTGNDANDGSSWTLAKKTVQAALNDASLSGSADIWVAQGVYSENIALQPYTYLYGGFEGNETERDKRDWSNYTTILDGNANGTVVTANLLGYCICRIDGFTITDGKVNEGGGIYVSYSSFAISNNTITGNIAAGNGGGIYCRFASPAISNNAISGNSANNGGGIYCSQGSSPIISNNTITNGMAVYGGGGIFCYSTSSPSISNNIIAFNSSGVYKDTSSSGTPILVNNCVYNPDGSNYKDISAGSGDISTDPKLVAYEYGQVHIQPDSPCRNAGYDAAVTSGSLDIDGEARIQGSHVDIGADESNANTWSFTSRAIRVSDTGNDSNNGSSWTLAKKTVQAAINTASLFGGTDIWVAKGVYAERLTLRSYAYLYGGFAGNETERDQRNWKANITVIDGSAGGSVVTADNIGNRTSGIDGFTIRNGIGTQSSSYNGGGIYCNNSSPSISNNVVLSNNATYGGGIYCKYASSEILNNVIRSNNANKGGGIYCLNSSSSLTNNIVSSNSAISEGGGLYCSASLLNVANNTITANTATNKGGGICCLYPTPSLYNNLIAFNSSGIYRYTSGTATLRNNCVYNPSGANYTGISAGTGDISLDPLFVNSANGNYHLSIGSPCINAGYDTAVGAGWLDMDGQTRIMGAHVDIGADELSGSALAVGTAKGLDNGLNVSGYGAIVSAVFGDSFYIESDNRSSGIRVEKAGHALAPGMAVDIDGVLATNSDGERYIAAESVANCGTGSVRPMYMIGNILGGGLSLGQIGVEAGSGLNNIGLLVKLTGYVKKISGDYFIIDDGSKVKDASDITGVRVIYSGLDQSNNNKLVYVAGISSIIKINNKYYRCIRALNVVPIETIPQ